MLKGLIIHDDGKTSNLILMRARKIRADKTIIYTKSEALGKPNSVADGHLSDATYPGVK